MKPKVVSMRESTAVYGTPTDLTAQPEPWSHPWHDLLGLRYHQAMARKIRRQPDLLNIPKDNLRRWLTSGTDELPSLARLEWKRILDSESLESILRIMTDPAKEGHRRRQSTPFAGILTPEERHDIRDQLLKESHDETSSA